MSAAVLQTVNDPTERGRIAWLEAVFMDVRGSDNKVLRLRKIARENPHRIRFGTLKNLYYKWCEGGTEAIIDRRKQEKPGKSREWAECFRSYQAKHNRSSKGAWRAMMVDFEQGAELPHGVGDWRAQWRKVNPMMTVPERIPSGWFPPCARYETLMRELNKDPFKLFNIAASRLGRKAVQDHILPVIKTRLGLLCGQIYEFDDQHIDVQVVLPGIGKTARPQAFVGYDIASGFQIARVMRPQFPEGADGKRNSLKEKEFRFLLAEVLIRTGFHPDGVRLVVEHGTTAVREGLERRIKSIPNYGNLITIERSGILSEAIHAGQFKGDGGGNFRFKAYCEQAHRIEHSARAMLSGQLGPSAERRPESVEGLIRYDEQMLKAIQRLPEAKRELIRFGLISWNEFVRVNEELTDRIYDATDHRLEGWDDKQLTVFRLNESDSWKPIAGLARMPEDDREAIMRYLSAHPENMACRRMSRREAWMTGSDRLVQIPIYELPLMLDPSDARDVTVKQNGTFEFRDQFYYGPESVVFHARVRTMSGFQADLVPGRSYKFFSIPSFPQGVVVDPESGRVVGVAPEYKRAPYYDREAIIRAAGEQNADLARKLMPVRGRNQTEAEARMQLIGHNADVFAGRIEPNRAPASDTPAAIEDMNARKPDDFWAEEEDSSAILRETTTAQERT